MNNIIITAPNETEISRSDSYEIFLAGTIDSGNSENWQKELSNYLLSDKYLKHKYLRHNNVVIFNPRRDEWPKDSDHEEIEKQIKWELKHLDESDLIIMNILSDSKSPISLMEIGLYAQSKKLVVFCTPDFYRYDNVKLVCKKYDISLFHNNDPYFIYLTVKDLFS